MLMGYKEKNQTSVEAKLHLKYDILETATHSSILAWRISWTEEPGVIALEESKVIAWDNSLKMSLGLTQLMRKQAERG